MKKLLCYLLILLTLVTNSQQTLPWEFCDETKDPYCLEETYGVSSETIL